MGGLGRSWAARGVFLPSSVLQETSTSPADLEEKQEWRDVWVVAQKLLAGRRAVALSVLSGSQQSKGCLSGLERGFAVIEL